MSTSLASTVVAVALVLVATLMSGQTSGVAWSLVLSGLLGAGALLPVPGDGADSEDAARPA